MVLTVTELWGVRKGGLEGMSTASWGFFSNLLFRTAGPTLNPFLHHLETSCTFKKNFIHQAFSM